MVGNKQGVVECRQAISTIYPRSRGCENFHKMKAAACTKPKKPNHVDSLEFLCSIYNSSTSFFLGWQALFPIEEIAKFKCDANFFFGSNVQTTQ